MTERRFLSALLAFLLVGIPPVAGESLGYGEHTISVSLQEGEHQAWSFNVALGDILHVEMHSTSDMDFYLTNESGYLIYANPALGQAFDFQFIGGECSRIGSAEISYLYNPTVTDVLVIIADNSNRTSGGTPPSGPVLVTGKIEIRERFWSIDNLIIIAGAVIAVIAIVAFAVSRWRRAPREEPHPRFVRVIRRVKRPRKPFPPQRKVLSRKK